MTPFENLALLRAFVRIVDAGSISAAARSMKQPQPTLSRQLRQLEEQCGVTLLRRDTHRMSLTEAGHRLLEDAQNILVLTEEAAHRLHEDQGALRGHLRLFATIDSGQFAITRLVSRFLKAHPEITAELGYSNRPLHMIQEGYDAGIVAGGITDESVVARLVGRSVRYAAAAPDLLKRFPAAREPRHLKDWPWLALSSEQFGGAERIRFTAPKRQEQTLRIKPVLVCEGVTGLREATLMGLGVTILPDWLVREDLVAGRLVRVLPQWNAPEIPFNVIYPAARKLSARVRAFVDFAGAHTTSEMYASR